MSDSQADRQVDCQAYPDSPLLFIRIIKVKSGSINLSLKEQTVYMSKKSRNLVSFIDNILGLGRIPRIDSWTSIPPTPFQTKLPLLKIKIIWGNVWTLKNCLTQFF